jgi:ring-1,2-phenylacetyl-CoA epoxidase subunit PaaC
MSVAEYTLRLGDDALIAAQRLAEWSARAPEMEEDVALSNMALDQLGAARLLLAYAGEADGRSEDDLAYLRGDTEFRNCLLVELPNAGPNADAGAPGDFGVTMARLLFLSAYQWLTYTDLVSSRDDRLAAIAAKARKESAYHLDHSSLWTVRLGDGTEQSHRRIQQAVDDLWPYTHELFATDALIAELREAGVAAAPERARWLEIVGGVCEGHAGHPRRRLGATGGRSGQHTGTCRAFSPSCRCCRAHPEARW